MPFPDLRWQHMAAITIFLASGVVAETALADSTAYPYIDENCGYTTTYETPPAHAVTLSNNATEMMLALGLEDHMAGTSYMAALTVSPRYEKAYGQVPVLSPLVATTEQLIDAKADFVYAGYPDGFSESRHTRDQLHDLGMNTHLNPEGCNLGKFGFEDLYAEIRSIAGIFGVSDRGEALIASISERLKAVETKLEGSEAVPVFIFNGGESAPNAVLGNTMLSQAVARAGGQNIFADIDNRYGKVSWEQIADRNPQQIVVFYSGTAGGKVVDDPERDLGAARIAVLTANPTIADVQAIKGENLVMIDSVRGQPGPSSIDAVETMARAFHPEAFAE